MIPCVALLRSLAWEGVVAWGKQLMQNVSFTEFFCGIGGVACVLRPWADSVHDVGQSSCAIDINQNALAIHRLNFPESELHRTKTASIESLRPDQLVDIPKQLWWMSPPCQPYTRRGLRRDLDDPRTAGLKNLVHLIGEMRPENIAMENVPEFSSSDSYRLLCEQLSKSGYQVAEKILCPSEFGIPNRRRRFYLVASQQKVSAWKPIASSGAPISAIPKSFGSFELDPAERPKWEATKIEQYSDAVDMVTPEGLVSGNEIASCFTSAYGRSPVRSGSYLADQDGVRFFTPREILALFGFPKEFKLPNWSAQKLWPLVGNSLSLAVVKYVLSHLLKAD